MSADSDGAIDKVNAANTRWRRVAVMAWSLLFVLVLVSVGLSVSLHSKLQQTHGIAE